MFLLNQMQLDNKILSFRFNLSNMEYIMKMKVNTLNFRKEYEK